MASNFDCIGLRPQSSAELGAILERIRPDLRQLGVSDGVRLERWTDESGATLQLGTTATDVEDLVPTLDSDFGARAGDVVLVNGSVASAAILDEEGEQATAVTFDAEDFRRLRAGVDGGNRRLSLVGLGVRVELFDSEGAFEESPASLLSPSSADEPAPDDFAERGLTWPLRIAAESVLAEGLFGPPEEADAVVRISGTVLRAQSRTNGLTGHAFTVARIRTVGFEADICLSSAEHPRVPEPGSVLSGYVYLVGRIDLPPMEPTPAPGRRRGLGSLFRRG